MTKYYLLGAAEALLLSIPVPLTLVLLALLLPVGWAFAGAGALAATLLLGALWHNKKHRRAEEEVIL
jgi:hypothetical protein